MLPEAIYNYRAPWGSDGPQKVTVPRIRDRHNNKKRDFVCKMTQPQQMLKPQRRLRLHRLVTIIVEKRQIRVITFTLPLLCNLVPHPSPEFQEQKLDT